MKKIFIAALLVVAVPAIAQVHVNGYTKKDGTYVAPHERTAPNNTNLDNYSTKGNVNPYTGQPGTKEPNPYGYQNTQPHQQSQSTQSSTLNQPSQGLQPLPGLQPITPLKF